MLSIHFISIMMRIFYIDWQQHWVCDRTVNIGENARANERYQRNSHKWQTWPPLTVGLLVTSERYWASFQVTRLFHKAIVIQFGHFFAATYVFVAWNLTRLITRLKSFFKPRFGWGALSSSVFTICGVYWSLDRRGYFGVSNVALVYYMKILRISINKRFVKSPKCRQNGVTWTY